MVVLFSLFLALKKSHTLNEKIIINVQIGIEKLESFMLKYKIRFMHKFIFIYKFTWKYAE